MWLHKLEVGSDEVEADGPKCAQVRDFCSKIFR